MNAKPLLFCSLVIVTGIIGCVVVQDKPADSAPPPPAPTATTVATADPTATATTTGTTTATATGAPGVMPGLGAARRSTDAGG
jgi:hypothetical protein